jgi:hypothetical protein
MKLGDLKKRKKATTAEICQFTKKVIDVSNQPKRKCRLLPNAEEA